MSKSFVINPYANDLRIKRRIKSRVLNCNTDKCWTFKNKNDQGKIWLTTSDLKTKDGKGRYLSIKRVLYFFEYAEIPDGCNIKHRCNTKDCLNPAHNYIEGFEPDYDHIHEQIIVKKILSQKDARTWYGGESDDA